LLVAHPRLGDVVDQVVVLEVAHLNLGGSVHRRDTPCIQAGTSTARLRISRWCTASKTRLMSSSAWVSTKGLIVTFPSRTRSSGPAYNSGGQPQLPIARASKAIRFDSRTSTLSIVKPTTDSVAPCTSRPHAVS